MTGINDNEAGGTGGEPPVEAADRALWQRSVTAETVEDEAERFLDLAGFADGRLDADERDRIADRLAQDPEASADVMAAGALASNVVTFETLPAHLIDRARAPVDESERGLIILFLFVPLFSPS